MTTADEKVPVNDVLAAPGRDELGARISLSYLTDVGDAWLIRAQWHGMTYHREAEVAGAVDDPSSLLPDGAEIRLDQRSDGQRIIVATWGGLLTRIVARRLVMEFDVVGTDLTEVERTIDELKSSAQAAAPVPEGSVRMRFWSFQGCSGEMSSRRVETPAWDDILTSYADQTAARLVQLMVAKGVESHAGRLILWHGAPGTGKTTAVRSLSLAWSDWCDAHYVMDPEKLFSQPNYLLEVAGLDDDPDDDRWRLVIAEDCDEYLRSDAKLRAGASLGRLLNLCDGILGHGLKVLVLLTTNEDVGRLHPAITRPGRCLSQVEFEPLSPAAARRWLGDGALAPERPITLAELYALRESRAVPADRVEDGLGSYL